MKRLLFVFVAFIFLFLFLPKSSFAQIEEIKNFDSKILINTDGTINVTEKIVYDFGLLNKHGIFRNIPYYKTNKEGKKYAMEAHVLSVKDENGSPYEYESIISNGVVQIKIGDPNRIISGVHTYVISYKMSGALTYFSDHDELYWNVTGNDWAVPITSSTSEVELPVGISQDKITTACYTGTAGSINLNCTISHGKNPITFQSQDTLRVYEGMTVVVGFPKGTVAFLEPKVYLTFWETIYGKITIALLVLAAIFWYLVYPIWIPIRWYLYGRDPSTRSGQIQAWFDPPKGENGRDLSPEEVGGLIDEKVDYRDFSAMIIFLAQKGYLRIEERKKEDFYFVRRIPPKAGEGGLKNNSSLLPHQKYFLSKLFEDNKVIRVKDADLYTTVQKTSDIIYTDLVEQDFFPKDPNKIKIFYSVIGIIALITVNFILVFVAFVFGRNMPKKTETGVEATNVGKSMKNFLSSQERQLEFQAKNQMMFEKLLPFAVAFGVEKIWAKRFEDIKMKQPDWYSGYGGGYFYPIIWVNSMNTSFSDFRSAATPTTSSSGFSSGFSNGFSGGGGGGGGGGSW